ncbi:prostamide/prostaglandin F synthase [Cynara cardunculus var. scolymus]|uniref:prostamide/prostaglandin F synthase n=1 Tax=Cynara cardunculus var. scolymus TaxID=59895 RepID=UPI000D62F1A7|nr:prostamide/prostaglandin F synthase [Cynara cardunculus var. scolymus]
MAITVSPPTITSSFSQLSSLSPFQSPPSLSYPSFSSSPTITRPLNLYPNRNNRTVVVPKASSTTTFSPEIADVLGEVNIFTASGDSVMFNELWDQSEGIAVVALLRHFGCPCCWELASTLKEYKARFESAGVKLIAIGIGEPKKARILAERLPFPLDILYADPERKAYDVLGLYYGIGRTFFNPASAKVLSRSRFEALQKAVKNYTIEATPDDRGSVLQQGGMFVFKGKELLYAWKDEGTGDHAPLDDIFNICCSTKVEIA